MPDPLAAPFVEQLSPQKLVDSLCQLLCAATPSSVSALAVFPGKPETGSGVMTCWH